MSEHVYCVAVAFKMTEQVEQQICIKFCIKLEHSSFETIWMIQKATGMGDWQLHHDNAPAHASHLLQFFGKILTHPWDSSHLQPRFGILPLLAFSKTKITLEWEEALDH